MEHIYEWNMGIWEYGNRAKYSSVKKRASLQLKSRMWWYRFKSHEVFIKAQEYQFIYQVGLESITLLGNNVTRQAE